MKRFKRILVATDTRLANHPIVEEAGEIARHNNASLKIVDVVPEFSWTVRLTLRDHQHMRELIAHEKQEKLDLLAAPIRQTGIDVTTKVLMGRTSVELIREVMRDKHDLLLGIAKGSESSRKGFFGNTAVRLLRKCPCAVWLVSPATTPEFKHVLGCLDTSTGDSQDQELNDKVYELASSISHYHGGRFSVVHAWSLYGEQILRSRMQADEVAELVENSHDQAVRLMDQFLESHGSSLQESHAHLIKGDAANVIPDFVRKNDVDLVVMGTVGRSGLAGMLMGNTAEQILNRIECSVLALKPSSFVSPIRLD